MHPFIRSNSIVSTARPAVRPSGARLRASGLLLAAALFGLGACSDDEVAIPETAATVEVTPKFSTVVAGQTRQLAAQAKNAAGANISNDDVVWRSLDTTVARVSTSGLVTVLSSGATAITATARGQSGFATIEAVGVVSSVGITGPSQLPVQQTVQLSATPMEVNGRGLFRPVTWASSSPTIATVSATGLVTTLAAGTTNITATSEGKVATLAFTVLPPPPVNTITLAINSGFLPTGVGVPLGVTLRDASGGVL
ncbi:MAG: Ig-like domain-containing protein, partial [Gemmatimonadaceae bacterium]|nr:Ig-like domain-containing protein [Gemmatimonadaceae bacterium]